MTPDTQSPWTNPLKKLILWEDPLILKKKFTDDFTSPEFALQTDLMMHFKPGLIQKERTVCLLYLFSPWLQSSLWWCACLVTCLSSNSSESGSRNSNQDFIFFLTTFHHPFQFILIRRLVLQCCSCCVWEPHPVITWRHMVLAPLFTPKLIIFISRNCLSVFAWTSDLWGWLSVLSKYNN